MDPLDSWIIYNLKYQINRIQLVVVIQLFHNNNYVHWFTIIFI